MPWEQVANYTPILESDESVPFFDEIIIGREVTPDRTIIHHHEFANIDEVGISLELWYRHRESHEKRILVIDTSVVFEEHRDAIIFMDDCLRVESRHEVKCEVLIHYMRTHDLDHCRDLGNLLEKHSNHL